MFMRRPTDLKTGRIRVKNWHDFVNATRCCRWRLGGCSRWQDDRFGQAAAHWTSLLARRRSTRCALPLSSRQAGTEYWLNRELRHEARDTIWAERGHEVAWEQFRLPVEVPAAPMMTSKGTNLAIHEQDGSSGSSAAIFQLAFDRSSGTLTSYIWRRDEH